MHPSSLQSDFLHPIFWFLRQHLTLDKVPWCATTLKRYNCIIIIIIIITIFNLPEVFMLPQMSDINKKCVLWSGQLAILLKIRSNKRAVKTNCIYTLDHDRQTLEQKASFLFN